MIAKQIFSRAFGVTGLEIRKKRSYSFPPEVSGEDEMLLRSLKPFTMTPFERLLSTLNSLKYVARNGVPGDFVECGVWRGGHAMLACRTFLREDDPRLVWLFDTFTGMTAPTEIDRRNGVPAIDRYREAQNGDINDWCYASLEDVQTNLSSTVYDERLLRYVKGPVEATLRIPDNLPEKIAILRLDTDWYESTKVELEVLFPLLVSGGVLMIDDYGHWEGSRKAVDEYFSSRGVYPLLQPIDYAGRLLVKV